MFHLRKLIPIPDRGPLRVMFVITSMPVGGAETLLVNLVRRLDRERFHPELCCLKELGPLGEEVAREIPAFSRLLCHKYDVRIWGRLARLFDRQRIDAVVTVGAGDKMFWGRLAAWRAGVPVVASALHSTGWPDGVGRLNRWLTPLTDAFIGVAREHGRHLVENERFPPHKVRVIPNGVDTDRFRPRPEQRDALRAELRLPADAPLCGIVAALRPEKNHELFLQVADRVRRAIPAARFLLVGDGPRRAGLVRLAKELGVADRAFFLGTRPDVPEILAGLDLFLLTSHVEANPVSILEAMSVGLPVVATRVGSIAESVVEGQTGYLATAGEPDELAGHVARLLADPKTAAEFGQAGRSRVEANWSLQRMVSGYQDLITEIYTAKCVRAIGRDSPLPPGGSPRRAAPSR
jgi:glycosyltransferase involved in cell wall biosynthesis